MVLFLANPISVLAQADEWCTDTDGGLVPDVKGSCTDWLGNPPMEDTCGNDRFLNEIACSETWGDVVCQAWIQDCQTSGKICQNGACVNDPCPCTTSLDCSNNWVERTTTCNGPECTNPTSSVQLIEDCSASGKICQNGACKLP